MSVIVIESTVVSKNTGTVDLKVYIADESRSRLERATSEALTMVKRRIADARVALIGRTPTGSDADLRVYAVFHSWDSEVIEAAVSASIAKVFDTDTMFIQVPQRVFAHQLA